MSALVNVMDVIKWMFPNGTRFSLGGSNSIDLAPQLPTDLFAIAAHLIERGSVYHRICSPDGAPTPVPTGTLDLAMDRDKHRNWCTIGRNWRERVKTIINDRAEPPEPRNEAERRQRREEADARWEEVLRDVQPIWKDLIYHGGQPVLERPRPVQPLPWWETAVALLVIADEAALHLGYAGDGSGEVSPFEVHVTVMQAVMREQNAASPWQETGEGQAERHFWSPEHPQFADTMTIMAKSHVARVLPKSRTPALGLSMRGLSHNLALLPPDGTVDFVWSRAKPATGNKDERLNLLVVPLPFQIETRCFRPVGAVPRPRGTALRNGRVAESAPGRGWAYFQLDQRWLRKDPEKATITAEDRKAVVDFLRAIIREAQQKHGVVHGLILPELALNWECYHALIGAVEDMNAQAGANGGLQFLVCGLSDAWRMDAGGAPVLTPGNFVATTMFGGTTKAPVTTTNWRHKHHRWRLEAGQIEEYALATALDPRLDWWEDCEIPRRKVDLTVFREGSVFSSMICEDLARSEPCHEPLRALGPNLVIALLMDGPQLDARWSARYATALADDPGSSVLTLTSLGLLERCNARGLRAKNYSIGLWKDDSTRGAISITCADGAAGVLLNLAQHEATESTIDGRLNADAKAWRYHGHLPIHLPADKRKDLGWVMGVNTG